MGCYLEVEYNLYHIKNVLEQMRIEDACSVYENLHAEDHPRDDIENSDADKECERMWRDDTESEDDEGDEERE